MKKLQQLNNSYFLNDFLDYLKVYRGVFFLVIHQQEDDFAIIIAQQDVVGDDPCAAGFPLSLRLDGHTYLANARIQFVTLERILLYGFAKLRKVGLEAGVFLCKSFGFSLEIGGCTNLKAHEARPLLTSIPIYRLSRQSLLEAHCATSKQTRLC